MQILIDGNNWFARDFFASGPTCSDNFVRRLKDVAADLRPDRVIVSWDSPVCFRRQLCPTYKAHRDDKPEGFHKTLGLVRSMVEDIDAVESLEVTGFEADDILAAAAYDCLHEGERAMIFSADRDLHQCLVGGQINQVLSVERVNRQLLKYNVLPAAGLKDKYGVHPHQWIEYRSMTGDTSDGIKGCVGIGPNTAAKVLSTCDSLDRFYASPFAVALSARHRQLLINFKAELPRIRELITLRTDCMSAATDISRHALASGSQPSEAQT